MDKNIMRLMMSYLIIGFLVFLFIQLRKDPERSRAFGLKALLGQLVLIAVIFYILPLFVFLIFHLLKVVIVQKYTIHQFKEHVYSVLFNQFNGYYVGIWDWIKGAVGL